MSSQNRDEIISRFIAIAQCSSKEAAEYLQSANWNEQAAIDFFFDSGSAQVPEPTPPTERKPNQNPPSQTGYESDDELFQSALEESLRIKPQEKSPVVVPKRADPHKSIISSKINTFDQLRKNEDEDSDDDDDDQGQAFYAGGSGQSGQQIIGPPKSRNNDKKVTSVFDAARKQGAREAHDDDSPSSSRNKQEKAFTGAGHSLGDNNTPTRTQGQTPSAASAAPAASNVVEKLPIRFYSNGFTVGDDELRKVEDNKEFMEYIKRGEVPPELRSMNTNGKQIEVSLEDHRGEEYKRVAPTFKPFGGTGHTIGLPGAGQGQFKSSIAAPTQSTTTTSSPDANHLEKLAEKRLKTSPLSTTIRLRLPDISQPVSIKIDLNRTLADVRKFLTENVPSLQSNSFEFMEPPSTKIKPTDEKRKISDGNLANSTLAVRRIA